MKKEPAREVEVEVLPKEGGGNRVNIDDPLIDFISRLMDEMFTIPGTKIRFGLDPLIGLLPGFGSTASALVSLFLIARSARHRLPRIVLAHMALNVLINSALDSVPVVGDFLSIFYRSNSQNYELLRKHAGTRPESTKGDWLFVGGLIGGVALILIIAFTGMILVLAKAMALAQHWETGV